jgi:hypothetical protein
MTFENMAQKVCWIMWSMNMCYDDRIKSITTIARLESKVEMKSHFTQVNQLQFE